MAIILGPKQRPIIDYSAGVRLKGVSEYSKGRLKTAYAVKRTAPLAGPMRKYGFGPPHAGPY
jgi:hypothetical protein